MPHYAGGVSARLTNMNNAPTDSLEVTSLNSKSERWTRITIGVALFALPLIYFYPAVLGKVTLAPGDGWSQIFGIRILIGQMLSQGQLPLWNPYIFGGMPLLASLQPGALYPPTWLFAIFPPQFSMNFMAITTYHLALIGTYLFARRIGCTRLGSLIAGMAFTFGGFMIAHLGHTNRVAAAAWLPWILLAISELARQVRWRWITLGACFIALQLFAGDPQMTFYGAFVIVPFALLPFFDRSYLNKPRYLASLFMMALCGGLLSLIQLLPAREMLSYGERAGIDYDYFSQFSYPPGQWLNLFFPYFFGSAQLAPYDVMYWGSWNPPETTAYVGLATIWLALLALFTARKTSAPDRRVWFWAIIAALALFLSFGSYLPHSFHHALFQLPVYKLFRAQGRHLFEFNFALSLLAGLGLTALAELTASQARRILLATGTIIASCLATGVVLYCFYAERLLSRQPVASQIRAAGWARAQHPDIFIPLIIFVLAGLALMLYRWRPRWAIIVLPLFFLVDAWSWGLTAEWIEADHNVKQALADPPVVKAIKARESNLSQFRMLSYGKDMMGEGAATLNTTNISIQRGVQSLNGYDPLRLLRISELAGRMSLDGEVSDLTTFDPEHKGFDLLNVKYLVREKNAAPETLNYIELGGVKFAEPSGSLTFANGAQASIAVDANATEIALVSALGGSAATFDGAPILQLELHTTTGQVIKREVQAGRDSAEWAYDRADVLPIIKHKRAQIVESWSAGDYQGHHYLTRLSFPRAQINRVDVKHVGGAAEIFVTRAVLFDSLLNRTLPINQFSLSPARWRKVEDLGRVELYENTQHMPRVWFVGRTELLRSDEVLQTIKTGKLPNGSLFEPAQVALLEREDFSRRTFAPPAFGNASENSVEVVRYVPQRIVLQTRNANAGLLVLSEIYYRGWEAWVDGKRLPIERVNYVLRGVVLAAGNHRVEFRYRAHSFRNGAGYSLLGIALLGAGSWFSRRRKRTENVTARLDETDAVHNEDSQ